MSGVRYKVRPFGGGHRFCEPNFRLLSIALDDNDNRSQNQLTFQNFMWTGIGDLVGSVTDRFSLGDEGVARSRKCPDMHLCVTPLPAIMTRPIDDF